jgi:hypothetical protein
MEVNIEITSATSGGITIHVCTPDTGKKTEMMSIGDEYIIKTVP